MLWLTQFCYENKFVKIKDITSIHKTYIINPKSLQDLG